MRLSNSSRVAIVVLLFAAFALRMANLTGESLWRDEVDSVRFAFEPWDGLFARFTTVGFNGPLYHLTVRGWLTLAGISDFALRYLSVVCGVLLVALIYVVGRRMFGTRAALIAAGLTTISPVLVWYAGEGKMYSLQPMLLTLALYALLRATSAPSPVVQSTHRRSVVWWGVFVVATSLSFYIHVLSPLFLPVALLFFAAQWPTARQQVIGGTIALALLTLPYLPLLAWQAPALLRGGDIGHRFYALDQIALALLSQWLLGLDTQAPLLWPAPDALVALVRRIALVLGLAIIVYGLLSAFQRAPRDKDEARLLRLHLATLGWMALPALLMFLISLRLPLFLPRYALWSAPAFYLLIGLGLSRLYREERAGRLMARAVLVAVGVISLAGVVAQVIYPIRPDVRGAVAYILARAQPGDAIIFQIPYMRHSFAYYAERLGDSPAQFRLVEAPFTNHGMSPEDAAQTMQALVGSASRVWLFESEAEMWDQRRLVRGWFDETMRLLDRPAFRGVEVGLYAPVGGLRARPDSAHGKPASCLAAAFGVTNCAITQAVPSGPPA